MNFIKSMTDQKISIVAQITANEGQLDFVKAALLKLTQFSKSDEGCINYNLHQDKENQNLFVVYENWENPTVLQKHTAGKHFVNFIEETKTSMSIIVNEMTHIA